jgi:hypothetical protein
MPSLRQWKFRFGSPSAIGVLLALVLMAWAIVAMAAVAWGTGQTTPHAISDDRRTVEIVSGMFRRKWESSGEVIVRPTTSGFMCQFDTDAGRVNVQGWGIVITEPAGSADPN